MIEEDKQKDTIYVYSDGAVRGRNRKICMMAYVVQDVMSNVIARKAVFDGHDKSSTECEIDAAVFSLKESYNLFKSNNIVLFVDSNDVYMRTEKVLKQANIPSNVDIQWIPRESNAADSELNTFALRKHVNKSAKPSIYKILRSGKYQHSRGRHSINRLAKKVSANKKTKECIHS